MTGKAHSTPEELVAAGYDRVADFYQLRYGNSARRDVWLAEALVLLAARRPATVLDLGCGSGLPVGRAVDAAGHRLVGIDASQQQVRLASRNVPGGHFRVADMAEADFPDETFDAVLAFYSITHVPRERHAGLFGRIRRWLKPGGFFLASLGTSDTPGWTGEWLGTKMYFSHFDAPTNLALVEGAGFAVETAEVQRQDDEAADFLWIVARKCGTRVAA